MKEIKNLSSIYGGKYVKKTSNDDGDVD